MKSEVPVVKLQVVSEASVSLFTADWTPEAIVAVNVVFTGSGAEGKNVATVPVLSRVTLPETAPVEELSVNLLEMVVWVTASEKVAEGLMFGGTLAAPFAGTVESTVSPVAPLPVPVVNDQVKSDMTLPAAS